MLLPRPYQALEANGSMLLSPGDSLGAGTTALLLGRSSRIYRRHGDAAGVRHLILAIPSYYAVKSSVPRAKTRPIAFI